MVDRFLNGALWLAVMGLIAGSGASAILICYHGLFDVFAARYHAAATGIAAGLLLAIGSYLLARNANDLMDR